MEQVKDGNTTEIAAIRNEIKYLQDKIRELEGPSIIDGERIRKICMGRYEQLSSRIIYIARAAVDGENIGTIGKNGKYRHSAPKNVSELTKAQREAAHEVANKIMDIFEEVYSRELWKKNES